MTSSSSSTPTGNKAAWLVAAKQHPFEVREAPMPEPGPGQVLVKNHATAMNPIDYKVQESGMMAPTYPFILGSDAAGEIVAVAADVKHFKPGDRVIALADWVPAQASTHSAFQHFFVVPAERVAKLPDHVSFASGCVLPLGLTTAAATLYRPDTLDLPAPSLQPAPNGQVLFVWGGSTSVGACAIMLAIASGYEVATTASPHNFDFLKRLGAKHLFDYKKPGVEDAVVAALKGKTYAGAVATIMEEQVMRSCAEITQKLAGRQFVATVTPPMMLNTENLPQDVSYGACFASNLLEVEKGRAIWSSWIPNALASGQLQCVPEPLVVGKGLEKIQEACDKAKTVSGRKIVVEL